MNKLLKSVRSVTNKRDDVIKQSITTHLSNSVKEIQYAGVEVNKNNKTVDVSEAANTLCTTIEAMLLHGLKDSLTHRFRRALADVEERPEPNFWAPLLVISHRQIVDQITNLSHITTEVGQCRAWIRLALTDCLLSSYLMTMRQDSSALKSFYRVDAYVRDGELLEVAQRLIEGVETFKAFTLPCNSSLLNTWPLPSLFLAGIWAPTLKSCPLAPCDDIVQLIDDSAKSIPETSSETASLSSAMSLTSQSSGLRQIVALAEEEVLKIILAKDNDTYTNNSQSLDDLKSSSSDHEKSSSEPEGIGCNTGNSLNHRTGWSFDENQEIVSDNEILEIEAKSQPNANETKSMEASYNALIESYNMLSVIKTPDLREVLQRYEEECREDFSPDEQKQNVEICENTGIITNLYLTKTESTALAVQIGKIARERGLDVQNYMCADCKQPIGLTQQNVCAFTGDYFCDSCMSSELIPIPARIIHNWDYKPYPISQKGLNYLNEIKDHPTIDFKVLNPYIYSVVEDMAHLQILRNQLNFLRAYLYTCREPVIEQWQKKMWPREYMYEHIHQYSVLDLSQITTRVLAQQLEKVVAFGKEHVAGCWLCSQKGFFCEVCNKPKPLFPFDVENIYRCNVCNAVYHKHCLNASRPCPKCDRKRKREELPLLGAISID